ncbi:hypothetical protein ABZS66_34130 [Dactylosporangium sp. NPDC005572]|uniref:baeRF3 domain-containing protein n=1 Tax=Dactylosporangium sp. NPDC005572 TaxID=3156889 RepID=UPI0033B3469A
MFAPTAADRIGKHASPPPAAQITALQRIQEYPAISVLLTTTPAAQLTQADALRLRALASRAIHRVSTELQPAAARPAAQRLANLVNQARTAPTSHALAIYASASTEALLRLPIPVRDRAVVDPTFATRDLVLAMHRAPNHLVLAFDTARATLLYTAGDAVLPALTAAFPMHAPPRRRHRGRGHADRQCRTGRRTGTDDDFYRQVDAALGAYLRWHPAPLVLVGSDWALGAFQRVSLNTDRVAGVVRGNVNNASAAHLATRTRAALDTYLGRRRDETLALIARRAAAGRVASGVPAAWYAARTIAPEVLAVDESLFYPARISDDGDTLNLADDVEHPDVTDDAVDELIELVLARGGWIAMTGPGTLDRHDGVALAVRT